MITIPEMVVQLHSLGVRAGGVLVVHTAFSKVKPVEGGPEGLIAALRAAVGPDGTVMMPTMSDDDENPFDVRQTPCRGMGIVADTFWRMPGVLRCDSPHGFAAVGPLAATLTQPQRWDLPHGPESPVGWAHDLDAQVLLLGVGQTENTTIHLGEYLAGVRYRRPKHLTLLVDGQPTVVHYDEIDHCCENFPLVDSWLEERGWLVKGVVGHAQARLANSKHIVQVVVEHLRIEETAFLHPYGVDEQCDQAREYIIFGLC